MNIKSKQLIKCKTCNQLRGSVVEELNGEVLVACRCVEVNNLNKFIIALSDEKFSWGRGSKYFNENNKLIYKQKRF